MELTGKYAGMIEALECDFSLAADPESEHSLDELQVKIENGDERMLTDIKLLSELSYGIRYGAIRIIGQPRSELCVPTAFDLEGVIEQLNERKDYLLKEFLLSENDLSVKHTTDARINEIDNILDILDILESTVNAANGKNGG